MDALIGRSLSHFRILEKLGEGGMGVVYRARDEKLRRDVAIKVLPPHALADETARDRFRHEALTLSRLNHGNIETVYGFDTQDGIDFLIVEYVDGRSLEKRLRSGPLPEDQAVSLAIQVASALEAAHAKHVVHCDLKPANVGITSDGRVKLLDFGIAQVLRPLRDQATTRTLVKTEGIAGTLAYMAPEQLLGKRVDGRVDLYALGVLLFQMTTGRVPSGHPPPSPRALDPAVSQRLEWVILRCLEKDPATRYQTAADLRADLERLKRDTDLAPFGGDIDEKPPEPAFPPSSAIRWSLPILVAVAIFLFVRHGWPPQPPPPPDRQVTFTGSASDPAISPDGQYAAFIDRSIVNEQRLFVQDLAGGGALRVFTARICARPRWSPDGSTILCRAASDSEESAFLVPKLGGAPRRLASAGPLHSWAPDGRRFVSASSTAPRLLFTDTGTGDTTWMSLEGLSERIVDLDWSPRGNRILVLTTGDRGRYSFWSVTPGSRGFREWFEDSSEIVSPRCSGSGDAVYYLRQSGQGGLKDLCKVRWAGRSKAASARPRILVHGLVAGDYFTVSRDGRRLLYTREAARSNLVLFEVGETLRHPIQLERTLTHGTSYDGNPAVSPDGKWVAFARGAGPEADIYRIRIDGGEAERLTFLNSDCRTPVWSANGDTIAFVSDKGGVHRVWRVAATGGPARPYQGIEVSDRPYAPITWAPGTSLLCAARGDRDYLLLDTRAGKSTVIGNSDSLGWIVYPRFSRDGGRISWWVAGPAPRRGMWVMTLPSGARVRILRDGPVVPLAWSRDGRWIYVADWRTARMRLARFPSDGGAGETHVEVPVSEDVDDLGLSADGTRLVCVVSPHQPDVWLAEGFDPRAK